MANQNNGHDNSTEREKSVVNLTPKELWNELGHRKVLWSQIFRVEAVTQVHFLMTVFFFGFPYPLYSSPVL